MSLGQLLLLPHIVSVGAIPSGGGFFLLETAPDRMALEDGFFLLLE